MKKNSKFIEKKELENYLSRSELKHYVSNILLGFLTLGILSIFALFILIPSIGIANDIDEKFCPNGKYYFGIGCEISTKHYVFAAFFIAFQAIIMFVLFTLSAYFFTREFENE